MEMSTYEVEIFGIGSQPLRASFVARSAGLARLAAQDKYGSWIRTGEVKELQKRRSFLARSYTSPSLARNRARRRAPSREQTLADGRAKRMQERDSQPVKWGPPAQDLMPAYKPHGMVVPEGTWK